MKRLFWLCLIPVLLGASCARDPKFSVIPEITEFVDFKQITDPVSGSQKGKLTFRFTDGDGDVGLNPGDTLSPFDKISQYYYNFFIYYYEKQNGTFVKIEPEQPFHSRIPRLSNHVPESIEVELSIDLDINPFSTYDTINLEFYVVDRALNHSNTLRTPDLILYR